jgi:hypothetical protein
MGSWKWHATSFHETETDMTEEIYSDGIGEITVTGTVVRLDVMSLSPTERDAEGNPKPVFRQRIIMPVDAFANAVDLMQKALGGLVEAGVLRRNPSAQETIAGDGELLDQTTANTSPNFN